MTLKVGDIVRLRSGGPMMTVERPATLLNREVFCSWFQYSGDVYYPLNYGSFPPGALHVLPDGEA